MENSKNYFKKSLVNIVTTYIKSLFLIFLSFYITPKLIEYIGEANLGAYKILYDWVSYVFVFEFGLTGTLLFFISQKVGEQNKNLNDVIVFSIKKYVKILPVLIGVAILLYFLMLNLNNFDGVNKKDILIGYSVICITILFYPLNPCRLYLEATQRMSFVNLSTMVQLIVTSLLCLYFGYIGWGLMGQCIAYTIGIFLTYLIMFIKVNRETKLSFLNSKLNINADSKLKGKQAQNFLYIVSHKLTWNIDNIVIAYFYNVSTVIPYYLTLRLPLTLQQKTQSLAASVWASLADIYHRGEKENFERKFLEISKFISILSLGVIGPLFFLNDSFVILWVGEKYYLGAVFTVLACLIAYSQSLISLWDLIIVGTGHVEKQSKVYLASAIINLILTVVLTKYYGLSGPLFGTFVGVTLFLMYRYISIINKSYDISGVKILKSISPSILVAGIYIMILRFLHLKFELIINNWIKFFSVYFICTIIFFILSWLILLNANEKEYWQKKIGSVLRR